MVAKLGIVQVLFMEHGSQVYRKCKFFFVEFDFVVLHFFAKNDLNVCREERGGEPIASSISIRMWLIQLYQYS